MSEPAHPTGVASPGNATAPEPGAEENAEDEGLELPLWFPSEEEYRTGAPFFVGWISWPEWEAYQRVSWALAGFPGGPSVHPDWWRS